MKRLGPALGYIRHMRLGFQLLLAPLFLWGLLLSDGSIGARAVIAFLSLHLFLYPGATAFNSAYDCDTGPVSGLSASAELPPRLLPFSIVLQLAGALLALIVGVAFTLLYIVLAAVFVGYSHPLLRWKANPLASAASVFAGQGVLGFAAGWIAAGQGVSVDAIFLTGALAAGATALGLYPSTQLFQVEEDAARGDRTIAVVLGPAAALRFGASCLLAAAAGTAWIAGVRFGGLAAALVAGGYVTIAFRHLSYARRLAQSLPSTDEIFRWATATRLATTVFFLGFVAWLLLRTLQ